MESNEQCKIPNFFKMNKIKLGGEENDKLFVSNKEKIQDNEVTTAEKVKFLFPDLSPQDIKHVLERAEYNIEKTIDLLKGLKQEQRQNLTKNDSIPKNSRKIKKRNYLELNQKIPEKQEENKNEINNINNNNNNNINNKKEDSTQTKSSDNINNDINKIINNLNEEKKALINEQINELLNKFAKMKDVSELKQLLIEIGFPLIKQDPEKEKNTLDELKKILDEKVKKNEEKKIQ